jgi:hypothetical protein
MAQVIKSFELEVASTIYPTRMPGEPEPDLEKGRRMIYTRSTLALVVIRDPKPLIQQGTEPTGRGSVAWQVETVSFSALASLLEVY